MNDGIGGYFELELPPVQAPLYPQAIEFQSARAAFLALIQAGKPTCIWMPRYICASMIDTVKQAGVGIKYYGLDHNLYIDGAIDIKAKEWLLYVNYFSVRQEYARQVVTEYGAERVVIDCSQALFSRPEDCLATIYSPRKFVGVPDGGLLVSRIPVKVPDQEDTTSIDRCAHLIKRLAHGPEAGYQDFHCSNASLELQEPRRMSRLSRTLLSTVDFERVKSIRNANFDYLHQELGAKNLLQIDTPMPEGPLCYPLLSNDGNQHEKLISHRIFVPKYWPELIEHSDCEATRHLARHMVPLPCDQRYTRADMRRIVDACSLSFSGHQKPAIENKGSYFISADRRSKAS